MTRRRLLGRGTAAVALAAAALAAAGVTGLGAPTVAPAPAPLTALTTNPAVLGAAPRFAPDSFWNRPIGAGAGARRDGASGAMVAALARYAGSAHLVNSQDWGYPVAQATDADPLYALRSRLHRAGPEPVRCRVPRTARASLGSDGHLTVLQPDGTACDFWAFARRPDGTPVAGTVARPCGTIIGPVRTAWGTVPCRGALGNGASAAGFALLGGVVTPEELSGAAPVDHALSLSLPARLVRAGGPVWPATHSDGACRSRSCIPQGARLQLDPRFDVGGQGWPPWKQKLARALQVYGAYVADRGGSLEVRAEQRGDDGAWTRPGVGIPIGPSLADLPWRSMRVLRLAAAR